MKNHRTFTFIDVITYLVVPLSLFWILYRFGFLSIIDTLAIGVIAIAIILLGIRWILNKKFISFGK
jgi:hypothetical protein